MLKLQEIPIGDTIEPKSGAYSATVNGTEANIYNCRVSAMPFNRRWPGYQRSIDQTELVGIMSFESDEAVTIKVRYTAANVSSAQIRPLSRNVKTEVNGNEVTFVLTCAGNYFLEINGDTKDVLNIFFNEPMTPPDKNGTDYYFGAGVHHPGIIKVKSGERIYIDMNAVVYGSILCDGVENVEISGYGILDGGFEARYAFYPLNGGYFRYVGNVRLENSKNVKIRGITLRDSCCYVLHSYNCDGLDIRNVKVIGQWKYNTDGFDFHSSKNIAVSGCFIRSFDDCLCIKGDGKFLSECENITVSDCVMWNDWGKSIEIGFDSVCFYIKNVVFERCDLIHNTHCAISLHNGGGACVDGVRYENINVEFSGNETIFAIQKNDSERYRAEKTDCCNAIIIENDFMWDDPGYAAEGFSKPKEFDGFAEMGKIKNVVMKNINITCPCKEKPVNVRIKNHRGEGGCENVSFENIKVNDKQISVKEILS